MILNEVPTIKRAPNCGKCGDLMNAKGRWQVGFLVYDLVASVVNYSFSAATFGMFFVLVLGEVLGSVVFTGFFLWVLFEHFSEEPNYEFFWRCSTCCQKSPLEKVCYRTDPEDQHQLLKLSEADALSFRRRLAAVTTVLALLVGCVVNALFAYYLM